MAVRAVSFGLGSFADLEAEEKSLIEEYVLLTRVEEHQRVTHLRDALYDRMQTLHEELRVLRSRKAQAQSQSQTRTT